LEAEVLGATIQGMIEKIPCKECYALILPATAVSNDGLCWPRRRGTRQQTKAKKQARIREAERASEARRRYEALLQDLSLLTDAQIVSKLERVPELADEDDPVWGTEDYWRTTAEVYVALSDISAKRRLRPSVRLLLQRACFGDPGEIMRGLRHRLEAIVAPDWDCLADICLDLAKSPRNGTRLWAIDQLAILEDPRAKSLFESSIEDGQSWISEAATRGLKRLNRRTSGNGNI
jgi:hypothetical protein